MRLHRPPRPSRLKISTSGSRKFSGRRWCELVESVRVDEYSSGEAEDICTTRILALLAYSHTPCDAQQGHGHRKPHAGSGVADDAGRYFRLYVRGGDESCVDRSAGAAAGGG